MEAYRGEGVTAACIEECQHRALEAVPALVVSRGPELVQAVGLTPCLRDEGAINSSYELRAIPRGQIEKSSIRSGPVEEFSKVTAERLFMQGGTSQVGEVNLASHGKDRREVHLQEAPLPLVNVADAGENYVEYLARDHRPGGFVRSISPNLRDPLLCC